MKISSNILFVLTISSAAGIAEAFGAFHKKRPTVTFRSPGAKDVIRKLAKGNSKYMTREPHEGIKGTLNSTVMFDKLIEDPLKPLQRRAIVISDARSLAVDELFDWKEPGEIQAIRMSGCVSAKRDRFDGVLGSVEYALMQPGPPPLLLVMGNAKNEVIEDAVRLALANASGDPWEDSPIVKAVLPAAKAAILQDPVASFGDICNMTAKLNVWNTIEAMLVTSRALHDAVKSGALEVHGAFLNSNTGKVHFMGEHPATETLLAKRPVRMRTAEDPPVPPEQALAVLHAGNKRYQKGFVVTSKKRKKRLAKAGKNPFAVVVGCAGPSAPPPEILFDVRPGSIVNLGTAGSTLASILGPAEYAVGNLHSKLVVVMGCETCGTPSATVEAVQTNVSMEELPGSVGRILEDSHKEAAAALGGKPDGAAPEQVKLDSELNVFATMEKMVRSSSMIADGVRKRDVQVVGAIYDRESGAIRWLGQHPRLEAIVGSPIPAHKWKYSKPYVRANNSANACVAHTEIEQLESGNKRFREGKTAEGEPTNTPFAIVLAGSELRVPVESIFDTSRGSILVQHSMGAIAGHINNTLFDSLEYSVQRFSPKLLLVLGASNSSVIASSLDHLDGQATSFGPTIIGTSALEVHEAIGASALEAFMQTAAGNDSETGGHDMEHRGLTVELNALNTVEQLLRHSKIVRDAVKLKKLEVQVGILQEDTGKVDFIGTHPMQEELVNDKVGQQGAYFRLNDYIGGLPTQKDLEDLVKDEAKQLDQTVRLTSTATQRDSGAYFRSSAYPMQEELVNNDDVQLDEMVRLKGIATRLDSGAYFRANKNYNGALPMHTEMANDAYAKLGQTVRIEGGATSRDSGAYFRSSAHPMQEELMNDADVQLGHNVGSKNKATWQDSGAYFRSSAHPMSEELVNNEDVQLGQTVGLKRNKPTGRDSGAYFRSSHHPMQEELVSDENVQLDQTVGSKSKTRLQDSGAYFRSSHHPMQEELVNYEDAQSGQTVGLISKATQRDSGAYFRSSAYPMQDKLVKNEDVQLE